MLLTINLVFSVMVLPKNHLHQSLKWRVWSCVACSFLGN